MVGVQKGAGAWRIEVVGVQKRGWSLENRGGWGTEGGLEPGEWRWLGYRRGQEPGE